MTDSKLLESLIKDYGKAKYAAAIEAYSDGEDTVFWSNKADNIFKEIKKVLEK